MKKSIKPPFFENLDGRLFENPNNGRIWILLPTLSPVGAAEKTKTFSGGWSLYHAWAGLKGYNPHNIGKDYLDGYENRDLKDPNNYYQEQELRSIGMRKHYNMGKLSENLILSEIYALGFADYKIETHETASR